ncbi:hypothetical protein [Nocardia tengchongensis]|uniref:hypothetical protein n=1 Tax=Nocardia tengchongensis TaxID=2055889 RepID=UPI0036AAEF78
MIISNPSLVAGHSGAPPGRGERHGPSHAGTDQLSHSESIAGSWRVRSVQPSGDRRHREHEHHDEQDLGVASAGGEIFGGTAVLLFPLGRIGLGGVEVLPRTTDKFCEML